MPDHDDAQRFLATYLRDHRAGAAAGVSLARRCAQMNEGTDFGPELQALADDVEADCRSLETIMTRLDVRPSRVKQVAGAVSERLGRLMVNDRLVRYGPLSRLLELDGLAAGIDSKRNLWSALLTVSEHHNRLDPVELDRLINRATEQHERTTDLHRRAAAAAFVAA